MAQEIERKFLVTGKFKHLADSAERIIQGYLCSLPERTVRIRVMDKKGFITVKGPLNKTGVSRFEWEKEIPVSEALSLVKLCEPGTIDKTRFLVKSGRHTFEVDEFYGENEGLVMAEIELSHENEEYERPSWLGEEVTGDPRYYNSNLRSNPFRKW